LRKTGKFTYVDGLTGLFTAGNTPALQNGAQHVLRSSGGIEGVRKSVEEALAQLKTEKKVLILDQPDVLLAASGDETGSQAVHNLILQLREVCDFIISMSSHFLHHRLLVNLLTRMTRTFMLRF
jgi:elongator complex protein 6